MDKRKDGIFTWLIAAMAIVGVIILSIAVVYAILHLESIANEFANIKGNKPYFDRAVAIAGTAIGLQLFAIVLSVIRYFKNKKTTTIQNEI